MILGIDYGKKWCGLAISEGYLAEPLKTVATDKAAEEVKRLAPEKVVVGISEGKMGRETKKFAARLQSVLSLPVVLADETLSSKEARKIKKSGKNEHAVAAALILQSYIDQ